MQEILLARDVYVLGLTRLLDWQVLRQEWAYTLRDYAYGSVYTALDHLLAYHPAPIYQAKDIPPSVHLAEQLLLLVTRYRSCECVVSHDRIYALLSLLSKGEERSWSSVDYPKPYVDILMDLIDDLGYVDLSIASPAMGRLFKDSRGPLLKQKDMIRFIKDREFCSGHRMAKPLGDQDTGSATGSLGWVLCLPLASLKTMPDVTLEGHQITFQLLNPHETHLSGDPDYIVAYVEMDGYSILLPCQARHTARVGLNRRAILEQRSSRRSREQAFTMYLDVVGQRISQKKFSRPSSRCNMHDCRDGCPCPERATWQSLRFHWRDLMALELFRLVPTDGDVQCPITTPSTRSYVYLNR